MLCCIQCIVSGEETAKTDPYPWDFVTLPDEDRATAVDNMHKNLVKIARVVLFSKRQRITLRLLYAIAIPSVVCLSVVCRLLSVTLVHPTQPVEIFGNFFSFFHHTIAQGLYFSGAKNRWWGTPLSP